MTPRTDFRAPESDSPEPKNLTKDVLRVACIGLFFVAAAWLLKQDFVRHQLFDIESLRARFRGDGWGNEMLFVAAAALANAFGVPRLWISAVAGTLFGAVAGVAMAMAASLIGSTANFYMGRYLLRGPLVRRMPERLRRWYDMFNENGFQAILYFRLFPLSNATVTNLVGGASHVGLGVFLAATLVGYLPLTIVFATLGSSAAKQSNGQLGLGLGLFCAVMLFQWFWKRRGKGAQVPAGVARKPEEALVGSGAE